jgi:predicted enzyme related to lactoylglutathione lyase
MAFFSCGDVRLLIGVLPPGQQPQRGSTIYFQVPDIQSEFSALRDRGVQFMAAPHLVNRTPQSELLLAEFKDVDDNQLALMSEVARSGA